MTSNIAEGMEKKSPKGQLRFLDITKGSCAELMTQIYIEIEIEYITKHTGMDCIKDLDKIIKMISV